MDGRQYPGMAEDLFPRHPAFETASAENPRMIVTTMTKWLERVSRAAAGLSFCVLGIAVLVQVLGRSVFSDSPVWTEELTRFSLLYLAAFGAGLAYKTGDMVNVDLVYNALPGRLPDILRLVSALVTAALCFALIGPAWTYTSIGALQTSPALGWPMDFIHASILVLLAGLGVFSLLRALAMIGGAWDDNDIESGEPDQ